LYKNEYRNLFSKNCIKFQTISKMPNNIRQANYYLRVDGRLPTGELKFSNQSRVVFEQKAVSIIIQLDRPEYRQESICKLLNRKLICF
jgi:hypothetical protein